MDLKEEHWERLFPFRLVTDYDGVIVSVGHLLARIKQLPLGDKVTDHFTLTKPRLTEWEPARFGDRLVILDDVDGQFTLKGEIIADEASGHCLYVGSPWIESPGKLKSLGIKTFEFPTHQNINEYFFLINARELAAAEAKENAESINEKNRILKYREALFGNLVANIPSGGALLVTADQQVLISGGTDLPYFAPDSEAADSVSFDKLFGDRAEEIWAEVQGISGSTGRFEFIVNDSVYQCSVSHMAETDCYEDRWLLIFQNITEDLNNRAQAEKLQRLDSVGHLAGGIAHDFNNYLTGILGNISLALEMPSAAAEALEDAREACFASRQLTRQLLTFSKGGDPVKQAGDLRPVIENSIKFSLSGSKVNWIVECSRDVLPCVFDAGQISQVINNLCLNAAYAMADQGQIVAIVSDDLVTDVGGALKPGPYIKIALTDTGGGIPEDILKQIWDPYFTTKKQGSGLGLATCHSITRNHGGTITVDSQLGKGTTFTLWLPAATTADMPAREVMPSYRGAVGKYKILLMDDQAAIRIVTSRILQKMGHQVVCTEEGLSTVDHYRDALGTDEPYDFVILDMTIPGGVGGTETLARLKEIHPDVYAVVCSGYTDENNLEQYKDNGFSASLPKPFVAKEVEKMLQDFADDTCLVS